MLCRAQYVAYTCFALEEGSHIQMRALKAMWNRVQVKWAETGEERFTFSRYSSQGAY